MLYQKYFKMPNLPYLIPGANWKHPKPQLQTAWDFARSGILIFPIFPAIGVFPILIGLVITWIKSTPEIISNRINWYFIAWSIWSIFVSLFASDPIEALLGLLNFLPYFGLFAAYSVLIQSIEQLRQLAWIFILSAIPVILVGFGEMWLGWGGSLVIWNTPPVHIWLITPGGFPTGRMASVFGYANEFGEYIQMVFIFAIGLWIDTWQNRSSVTRINLKNINFTKKSLKLTCLTVFIINCGIALIFTSSRAAWAGAIFSILIFAVYQSWYWLLGIVSALIAIIFSSAYAPNPIKEPLRTIVPRYFWARITDEMYPNRPDEMTRLSQWKFAWKLTMDRPVTGWGLQSFGKLYQAQSQMWFGHPHNLILMLCSNLGIPATIVFVSIIGYIVTRAVILLLYFPIELRYSHTIFFTFTVAFCGFILSQMSNVAIADLRLNTFAWLILSALYGLFCRAQQAEEQV
jgi:O-antigen ligase